MESFYWDASCFFDLFKKDRNNHEAANQVMNAAGGGKVQILTSTNTIAEVAYLFGRHWRELIDNDEGDLAEYWKDAQHQLEDLWRPGSPVGLVEPSDRITTHAAKLVRQARFDHHRKLTPMDAVHVATAISEQVSMHTSDERTHWLNQHIPISITAPQLREPPML